MTFNNNAHNYTISGSNGIAGGSLIKNGTGTVTINTADSMNGGTLNAGTLLAGNNNAISSLAASADDHWWYVGGDGRKPRGAAG